MSGKKQFKAWSQNLGHEQILTAFLSYGEVICQRQGEIIRGLATPQRDTPTEFDDIAKAVVRRLREAGVEV